MINFFYYFLTNWFRRLAKENNASEYPYVECVWTLGPVHLLLSTSGDVPLHQTLFLGNWLIRLGDTPECPGWWAKVLTFKRKVRKLWRLMGVMGWFALTHGKVRETFDVCQLVWRTS